MDKVLAKEPLKVPVMLVHGLWDQEDIYGALAVYRAIEPKDTDNDRVFLVLGPWYHGQQIHDGSALGAIRFGSDTALTFRQEVLRPFLAHYLIDGAPEAGVAPVTAFETGTNRWEHLSRWPAGCAEGCTIEPSPLYLEAGAAASFEPPAADDAPYSEYVSDPAHPVPFIPRPVGDGEDGTRWRTWLVHDQREAASRPDVLTFVTGVLDAPVEVAGRPAVNLVASTSGTDSDWVVKLIDVYPDEVAAQPEMGGYQLPISEDIFRGRYRKGFAEPAPLAPGEPLIYRFALPAANHVFLPGHRIMVQVQSTWFPLYDRNPQTFVDNIFDAQPGDYQKATQRVYHAPGKASFLELPVVRCRRRWRPACRRRCGPVRREPAVLVRLSAGASGRPVAKTTREVAVGDERAEVVDQRVRQLDAGQPLGEALLEVDLHLALDLDALRLRRAGAVQRLGEVADGVPAERHVLDQAQDAQAVLGRHVGAALQVLVEQRAELRVAEVVLRRQRSPSGRRRGPGPAGRSRRASGDVVLADVGQHVVADPGAGLRFVPLVGRGDAGGVDRLVEVGHLDQLVLDVRRALDAVVLGDRRRGADQHVADAALAHVAAPVVAGEALDQHGGERRSRRP